MKRLVLATASVLAFVFPRPALSADLGPIAPIYKPAAVPSTPFFTWTGCYLGAHVGGGLARKTFADTASGHLVADAAGARVPVITLTNKNAATTSFDPSGFIGGGQFGCNYQFAQEWVAGIEADIEGADVQGSKNAGIQDVVSSLGPPATTTTTSSETVFHYKSNWLASATARFGYAPGPWLFYVKGGVAWIPDKFSITNEVTTTTVTGNTTTPSTSLPSVWTASSTRTAGRSEAGSRPRS
jgi:outer membrane immunogenic protein